VIYLLALLLRREAPRTAAIRRQNATSGGIVMNRKPGFATFALLLAASTLPAAAQNAYPNGKSFNCKFTQANGATGTTAVSFNLSGTLGKQQGTMTSAIAGGPTLTPSIELTRPRFEGPKKVWDYRQPANNVTCRLSTWAYTVEWDNCSNGNRQTCAEVGAPASKLDAAATAPYLIIKEVQIKDDHEWLTGGAPEFEINQVDPKPCDQGTCYEVRPDTKMIFDGQTRTDDFGRQIRLPDVNDTYRWYPLSTPIYLPYQVGMGLLGVEDDDTKGKFKRSNFSIEFSCSPITLDATFKAGAPASLIPFCWPTDIHGIRSLWGGDDDEYKKMLVITHGLDQGRVDVIDGGDWLLKVTLAY
jgi:hypothetical protein